MTEGNGAWLGITGLNTAPPAIAAAAYAAAGLPVFPCFWVEPGQNGALHCSCGNTECDRPGKHPIVRWKSEATTDRVEVGGWWAQWPNANIGIPTGAASNFLVLDLDRTEIPEVGPVDGRDELGTWCQENHAPWPLATLEQRTGGGGGQLVLQHVEGARTLTGWLPGVDVRADGGYILVPPSGHISGGTYQWLNELGPAPAHERLAAVLKVARGHPKVARNASGQAVEYDYGLAKEQGPPPGVRDHFFNKYAYELRSRGVDRLEAEHRVTSLWERCDHTSGGGFGLDVALEKLERVWREVPEGQHPDASPAQQSEFAHRLQEQHRARASAPVPAAAEGGAQVDAGRLGMVSKALVGVPSAERWETHHPSRPEAVARDLLRRLWTNRDDCLVLRHWLGDTYEWHLTEWGRMPPDHLDAVLLRELRHAYYLVCRKGGGCDEVPWNPTPSSIASVARMIRLTTIVHARTGANHWIDCTDGRCPVGEFGRRYLSFTNGILDRDTVLFVKGSVLDPNNTGVLYGHDSAFFNTWSLGFAYDPKAQCPRWVETLEQWFPGDQESRDTLEEILGHLLLGGMEYDKIFMLLGHARSGKGTVMRLLAFMLRLGYATQSLDELADRFGLEDLIGKTVCHISEMATNRDIRKVTSLIKSISGQDTGRTVKKKGEKSDQEVDLMVRFVLTGNEEVVLPDDSGVIVDRMVVLWFGRSFLGKENEKLTEELAAESSGIFNRLQAAYARLTERGRFVQPKTGEAVKQRLRAAAAPGRTWWDETFEVTGDLSDWVPLNQVVAFYRVEVEDVTERAAQMQVKALLPPGVIEGRPTIQGVRTQVLKGVRMRREEGEI